MGSLSKQDALLLDSSPLYTEGIRQFSRINILKDYIPHPNSLIESKLSQISQDVETQIRQLSVFEKGPYISQLFGKLREEAFRKFEGLANEYPEPKRSEYIKQFYVEIDQKYQALFEKDFDLRELYIQNILDKDFPSKVLENKNDSEREDSLKNLTNDHAIKLLNNDMKALIVDWYILIEKTVDVLVKCGLYKIKTGSIYRDLYKRIKNQRNNDNKSSWREKLNWNSFIPFQSSSSRSNSSSENEMPYADAMDCRDIFTLVIFVLLTIRGYNFSLGDFSDLWGVYF